jgi:aminoglycoside phosphotransferase
MLVLEGALAKGLRKFHQRAQVSACPFDFCLDAAFEHFYRLLFDVAS